MHRVERTYKGETKKHPIYTLPEAEDQGIPFVPWRDARSSGQWVLTDDDYVCEVISVNGPYSSESSNSVGIQLVLPFARPWVRASVDVNFEEFSQSGNPWASTPKTWDETEAGKTRTKRAIRLYAKVLVREGRVPEDKLREIAKLYRPDVEIPVATFKRLLKKKAIKKMVQQQLEKILLEHGITEDQVISDYKEVFDKAQANKQHGVAKSVLDTFAEMLGMGQNAKVGGRLPDGGTQDGDLHGFLLESEKTEFVDNEEYMGEHDYEVE